MSLWDNMTPEQESRLTERMESSNSQMTQLELAKRCLQCAVTGTHNPTAGEVRRAIITIFGPEVDAQLQADLLKPL